MDHSFVLKGDICYSTDAQNLCTVENGYLVCENGVSRGVYPVLPEEYKDLPLEDHTGCIIVPGLVDLHVHAPQYAFRSLGMDQELLEWLNMYAFPEESKYREHSYADEAYGYFTEDLRRSATTRACIFGTLHREATELLMKKLADTGLDCFVGKVNMDRNSPDYLCETNSLEETDRWLEETLDLYPNIHPILTPRFTPSCTDSLMAGLHLIQQKYDLPVQSHLSENLSEIAWVKELCPWSEFYGDTYDHFGLFGGDCPTIMAHCVHSPQEEISRMKERGVFIAHCPQCNMNVASGIAPARRYLENGLRIGLGSDIAGGSSISIFRAMTDAIQVSKLYWRIIDQTAAPLTVPEAFYLGTMGGGAFWKAACDRKTACGSFLDGYEMDAVVIRDDLITHPQPLTLQERLERVLYLSDDRHIKAKYVNGKKLF